MVPLCGRPLAQWQLEWLKRHGVKDVVFAVGYCWEKLKELFGDGSSLGLRLRYSVEEEPLGTGGAIKKAMELVAGETVLVMNGDIVTGLDLQEMARWHYQQGVLATQLAVPLVSPYGVLQISPGGLVEAFVEKPALPDTWINGGVYVLSPGAARQLPRDGDIETTLFPALARAGELSAFRYRGFWRTVDGLKELEGLEKELATRL